MKRLLTLFVLLSTFILVGCKQETFKFLESELSIYLFEEVSVPFEGSKDLAFESNNDNISINQHQVKGLSVGESIIKTTYKNKTYELKVNIKPVFKFNDTDIIINIGDVIPINYELVEGYQLDIEPINELISYTNGEVKAHYAGISGLKATIKKGSDTFITNLTITISEEPIVLESIHINVNTVLNVGETAQISLTSTPLFYNKSGVIYTSSDEKVFIIESGSIKALKPGSAQLTATLDGKQDVVIIKVNELSAEKEVEIYYLNDLHGAIEPGERSKGLAYIGNFIEQRRQENPNIILLAGGDMLQGSALSNHYQGSSTLTLMNMMGFDAMVIGNHEFDWGLKTVTDQFNEETSSLNFPLLGINVREKATNQIPENIKPYTMVEKNGLKVGVIGAIGENLESSIANKFIKDYEFIESLMLIKEASKQLRLQGADFVVLVTHDYDISLNNAVAQLVGEEKVDAIFNAHTHSNVVEELYNKPIIQSGANGGYVGYVKLNTNGSYYHQNISSHPDFYHESPTIKAQIDLYKAETDVLFYDAIMTNRNTNTSSDDLSYWLVNLMKERTNADIAFHNFGGTRTDLRANEEIHLAKLYQIWPFDNIIKTVKLKGNLVKQLMSNSALLHNDIQVNDNEIYLVVTHDYIFDYEGNQHIFNQGTEHTITELNIRDLAKDELIRQSNIYPYFDVTNSLNITNFFIKESIFAYL